MEESCRRTVKCIDLLLVVRRNLFSDFTILIRCKNSTSSSPLMSQKIMSNTFREEAEILIFFLEGEEGDFHIMVEHFNSGAMCKAQVTSSVTILAESSLLSPLNCCKCFRLRDNLHQAF